MTDDSAHPAWDFGNAVRGALLLDEARAAFLDGEPYLAIALAEEALDEDPDDLEALTLIADAAPRWDFAELGVLACAQIRARGGDPGAVEAAATFAACQVERSLEQADALIARNPKDARAWAVRGQALEILGAPGASEALSRANELRPDLFPVSLPFSEEDWQRIWDTALAKIQEDRRQGITVRWQESPTLVRLRESTPPSSPGVVLLLSEDRVCEVYRRNLVRGRSSEAEVAEELSVMLGVEIAFVLGQPHEA